MRGFRKGWFRLKNGEKAWLFVTSTTNVLHLPTTEGYSLLLSIAQPEALLSVLRQATHPDPSPLQSKQQI